MRRSRSPFLAGAGAVMVAAALVAGCQPPVAQPLTDPREVLSRMVASTAALRTASVRLDFQSRTAADPKLGIEARADGGTVEGEVDLAGPAWTIRGAENDGSGAFAAILVDETMYTQTEMAAAGRWTAIPFDGAAPAALMLGGGAMNAPDYHAIIQEAIAGPAIRAELAGVQECATGRCYHVGVEIPREQVWPLVSRLAGLDQIPGLNQQAPPVEAMPNLSLAMVVDAASLYLVSADLTGAVPGSTFQARLELREPNEPVSIEPPPPHLVDRMDGDFFGGGVAPAQPVPSVLEEVGEEIESEP